MSRARRILGASILAAAMSASAGCLINGPWDHGDATIQWTVAGRDDRAACSVFGGDRVNVRTFDVWGELREFRSPSCDAFEETIRIEAGSYYAELTMVDVTGRAVGAPVRTPVFRVTEDGSTVVPVVDLWR